MKVFTPVPLLKVIAKVSHNCDDRAPSRRRHTKKAVFEWRCAYSVAVSLADRVPVLWLVYSRADMGSSSVI